MQFPPNRQGSSNDDDKKPGDDKQNDNNRGPQFNNIPRWVWFAVWGLLLAWAFLRVPEILNTTISGAPIEVPYSVFIEEVEAGNVEEVTLQGDTARGSFERAVTFPASPTDGEPQQTSTTFTTTLLPIEDSGLRPLLDENGVSYGAEAQQVNTLLLFLLNWGPILLLIAFLVWTTRRARQQASGIFGFGQSQAREYKADMPSVTFEDVAGQNAAKSELEEVVDFLKEPDKYIALGARIPKGVLLVGPPGTGKTLLARAVAGEANVAFFSISASEFVEMFVGVGASRVRDLFKKAKNAAPAIIFIDEIDAVGRQRGAGLGGGNDEREQTLNQMLAEMDGFDQSETVVVMAATNRPDVLDPALLRPGRFDRQVTVGSPDRTGREAILKIHTRGKPLAEDVNLETLSKATIGFSGADLANLANEAALTAARKNHKRIAMRDFSDAFDRIVLGTESPPLSNADERRVVAYHEAGHALVAALTPYADPVLKVTIVPRGQALGVAVTMPDDDRRNYSQQRLMARIFMALGGRAAEEVSFGEITTGASSDLKVVTDLARRMVSEFGMSKTIGPLNFGDNERQPFLGYSLSQGRNYSDETASKIDEEVRVIVEDAYQHTLDLMREHQDKLNTLAEELLEHEVVDQIRLMEIVGDDANTVDPSIILEYQGSRNEGSTSQGVEETPLPPPDETSGIQSGENTHH